VYPAPFEYVRVRSWEEAVAGLSERIDQEAKVLAGGQSLVPMMALRLAKPGCLVDINDIPAGQVRIEEATVVIPALTRHAQLQRSTILAKHCPLMAEAASLIGNIRVRHRGTIGGSLAHAESSAELPCVAVAAGAEIVAVGPGGERTIPAREFFHGYFTTALEPAELVREVRVPALAERTGWAFVEFVRRTGDFALVEVAALVELDEAGESCTAAEVVVGGVADRPLRVTEAAAALVGSRLDESSIDRAAELCHDAADPAGSEFASAEYRRHLVRTLTGRALSLAAARASGDRDGAGR
jgi:CO/xanthine dehydrogenase FAD-binding subunit